MVSRVSSSGGKKWGREEEETNVPSPLNRMNVIALLLNIIAFTDMLQ